MSAGSLRSPLGAFALGAAVVGVGAVVARYFLLKQDAAPSEEKRSAPHSRSEPSAVVSDPSPAIIDRYNAEMAQRMVVEDVELKGHQYDFLSRVADERGIDDNACLRALINYAMKRGGVSRVVCQLFPIVKTAR